MKLEDVRGMMSRPELERLRELAANVPDWARIVEIGTHTGLSTCWMADAAKRGRGAHVVAVDPYPPARPGSQDDPLELGQEGPLLEMRANLTGLGLWTNVTPLRMTSLEAAAGWQAPIGLLFIDAVHEYQPLTDDIAAWAGFLIPGGWLALHDFNETGYPDVPAVVRDQLEPSGAWNIAPLTESLWTAARA